GAMLKVNQGHPAGAERCALVCVVEDGEAEHVTVEAGHAFDLAHLEPDRADMERGAVGERRDAGRVRGIHDSYIDASARPRNSCLRTVGAEKAALLGGGAELGRPRRAPCRSIPRPSAASRSLRALRSPSTRLSSCAASSMPFSPLSSNCRRSMLKVSSR